MGVETDIENGIYKFFRDNHPSGVDVAYPNSPYDGSRPYISISRLPAPTFTRTLNAKGTSRRGIIQIDVIVDADTGAVEAQRIADQVLDLLPPPYRIEENEVVIRIDEEGSLGPGFNVGSNYKVPVSISYIVLKTRG